MRPFGYRRAESLQEAIGGQSGAGASKLLAGGTTLIDLIKLDVERPESVVDVNGLPLAAVRPSQAGGLRIGAMVRNSDLAWNPLVKKQYPALAQAILSGASPQLRNRATTGGNLMQRVRCPYFRDNYSPCNKREPGTGCSALDGYHRMHAILGVSEACIAAHPSDMCVALAAYEATIHAVGENGERAIPFRDFHLLPGATPELEHALQPGEIITEVELPPPLRRSSALYLKVRDRASYEFALASAAVILAVEDDCIQDVRIALGGVGTKPWRAEAAEQALRGQKADEQAFAHAAQTELAAAQPRRDNAFKIALTEKVICRGLALALRLQNERRGE